MLTKTLKLILKTIAIIFILIVVLLVYSNIPVSTMRNDAQLGITFSARYAREIGLDPKEVLSAILDDIKVKKIRIPVYWDAVEKEKGVYDFSDVDWQIAEAGARNAEVILVVGQKVPRWPECFIPKWTGGDDMIRKESLLALIGRTVGHYKDEPTIKYWQVENEPFLSFGVCPALDVDLLDAEIDIVHNMDSSRKVIVTDSGELSLWVRAASRADIFGTTLYRTIWSKYIGYFDYPIGPRFFQLKYQLIRMLAGQDNAIVIELQGEPWISGWTTEGTLDEQFKSMDPKKFHDNIIFAKKVGFPEIYLWGAEWWYWLKVNENRPEMWDAAREEFSK